LGYAVIWSIGYLLGSSIAVFAFDFGIWLCVALGMVAGTLAGVLVAFLRRWIKRRIGRIYWVTGRSYKRVVRRVGSEPLDVVCDRLEDDHGLFNLDECIRADLLDVMPEGLFSRESLKRIQGLLDAKNPENKSSEQLLGSAWWLLTRGHLRAKAAELKPEIIDRFFWVWLFRPSVWFLWSSVDFEILAVFVYLMRYKITFYNGPKPDVYLRAFCKRKLLHSQLDGAGFDFYVELALPFVKSQGF
jgi:hypothetical protein